MIVAGELSGDIHGASLIKELKKLNTGVSVCGIGGDNMVAAGMKANYHINKMAFLGFIEIIKHIPFIKKVQKDLVEVVNKNKIKTIVLIDYPGFNLSLAKKLKKLNTKIIYYIAPQIWAWGKGRINKIKKLIDEVLVVLPFEEKFFKEENINAAYVGHPLIEQIENYNFLSKEELFSKYNLDLTKEILLVLPGSRKHEVETIFPPVIAAAKMIAKKHNLQIIVPSATTIDKEVFESHNIKNVFKIVDENVYDFLRYSKFGIIKSGTSTLEAALMGLPMIVVYKANYITYLIGKNLVRLDKIGLVNIIGDEFIVPELIQNNMTTEKIILETEKILNNKNLYDSIKNKLSFIKEKLGTKSASKNAARIICSVMNEV